MRGVTSKRGVPEPYVAVLSTGGTIAMRHDEAAGGAVPQLTASDLASSLPANVPPLRKEEVTNLPSSHFTIETLEAIRSRVARHSERSDVAGIVVTHGTDTMEETAYLLDLTVPGDKPIALTGAMRTVSDVGYDGYANLLAAVRVAAAPQARGLGAVVVFNDEIHAASRATKTHTLSPSTFQSPGWGPVGRVEGDSVIVDGSPRREILPWHGLEENVALIKMTVGARPDALEDALARGYRGVVIEGLGAGRVPPEWLPVIERGLDRGMSVVIASRCFSGRVWDRYGYEGAYRTLADLGCLFAHHVNGQKARIRLMIVLAAAETQVDVDVLWGDQAAIE